MSITTCIAACDIGGSNEAFHNQTFQQNVTSDLSLDIESVSAAPRFSEILLEEMFDKCDSCMNVERFTQMYVSPTSVIWSACAVFFAYEFARWISRFRSDLDSRLQKLEDAALGGHGDQADVENPRSRPVVVSTPMRLICCLRRVRREETAEAAEQANDASSSDANNESPSASHTSADETKEGSEMDETPAPELPSPGMSFVYTEASTIVQARVIRVLEKSAEMPDAKAELLIFHKRHKLIIPGTINLSKQRLPIGESSFDMAVISSSLMTELFLTLTHIILAYWSMFNYFQLTPKGAGWPCLFIHIVLASVFKPLAPSMWLALMSVGQFVIWHSSARTPEGTRRATATRLTPPPLPLNVATYACVYATALPLLVWAAAAIPFVALLLLPPLWPLLIANLILLPALLMRGLPLCLR